MAENRQKLNTETEFFSAALVIAVVSAFILSNLISGFSFFLYVFSLLFSFIIVFFYPRSGVYAIIFLTFVFERFFTLQSIFIGRNEYKIYPLDILIVGIILGIIFQIIGRKIKFNIVKTDLLLVIFILLNIVYFVSGVLVFDTDFDLSFSSFKNYAFYSLLYFVIVSLFTKKENLAEFIKFSFAGAVAIIFFIAFGFISGEGLWTGYTPLSTEGVRLLAFTHAFYLSIAFLGALSFLTNKASKKYIYFLLLFWGLGIIGSMMRHLWISLFIGAIILYLLVPRENKIKFKKIIYKYSVTLIIVAIFAFYVLSLFPNSKLSEKYETAESVIGSRIITLFQSTEGDESFQWRNVAWKEAMDEFYKNPLLGTGFGQKVEVEVGDFTNSVEIRNIHNSLLVLLVQMGIATFAIFVMFVFSNARNLMKKARKNWIDYFLLSSLAFYLIAFLFQPYLEANLLGIFFWIILGLIRVQSISYEDSRN